MSKLSRALSVARGPATVYLGAAILGRVGAFFLVPLYTRRLSLEEYGRYTLFLTIVTFLSTFLSLGLVSVVAKSFFSVSDPKRGKALAASVATWIVLFCVGGAAALAAAAWVLAPSAGDELLGKWSISLAILGGAGMAIGSVPIVLLRAEQRVYAAAGFQLLQFASMTGAGLAMVAGLDRGYRGAVEAGAGAQIVTGLVATAYVLSLQREPLRLGHLRESLRFSLPFIPHFMGAWVLAAADRWLLRATGHDDELGQYSLATQIASPVSMVVLAYNDSVGPQLGQAFRAGGLGEMRAHLGPFRRRYLLALAGTGVLLCCALPLIALLIGEAFQSSLMLVPFIILTLVPDPTLYSADYHVAYFAGRTRAIGSATIVGAVLNVVINLALVPWLGVWGAIVARFVGGAARAGIVNWAARTAVVPDPK